MKLRLKVQEIRNNSMSFAINVDGETYIAACNPIKCVFEDGLHPTDDYAVADACEKYQYGIEMSQTGFEKLYLVDKTVYSIVLREMKEIYEKIVHKKIRTAARQKVGIVLDNNTWKYHYLRTAKCLSTSIAL